MTPYLLDTNIASCIIKGNSPAVDRRLVKVAMAQLAISAVTEGELRFGAARLPRAARLHSLIEEFLLRVAILPWDSDAARQYGQLRATLEREGQPIGNREAEHVLRVGRGADDAVFLAAGGIVLEAPVSNL